ncbi:Tyrosine-protein phosphatase yvh1 [Fusarium oxysporum f. sp. albedinis]|nr:Tyrosine-protein phosphatase yvh1 [Fusarium oxysporum f. sp. albedinis]
MGLVTLGRGLVCMFQDFQAGVFGTNQGGLHFPRQRLSNAQKFDTHQPRPWHWGQMARLRLDEPTMMSIGPRKLLGMVMVIGPLPKRIHSTTLPQ